MAVPEEEPLLVRDDNNVAGDARETSANEETKSTTYLILLTLVIGGLQIVWSVELASISPFLLSLGLSKSLLALVWIAGPLCGTVVQPIVGVRSDKCLIRWGRRRPFIVGGAIGVILSLLALAWTRELVSGVSSLFRVDGDSHSIAVASQVFAVVFVYISNVSINVIQAGIRMFIVDCAPTHQQADANAWASRITGLGNIIGFLAGYINLPKLLPWLGNTQFKVLVAVTCVILTVTLAISCLSVSEQDPRLLGPPPQQLGNSVIAFFRTLIHAMKHLPPQIRKVCVVQLFAWVGWFPFLFYTSTYIAGIYSDTFLKARPDATKEELDKAWEDGTRIASFALFIFAITQFAATIILPMIIVPPYVLDSKSGEPTPNNTTMSTSDSRRRPDLEGSESQSRIPRIARPFGLLPHLTSISLRIHFLTVPRAWLISHLIFALLMLLTFFVHNTTSATVLVAFIGIPWAMTNWAPFALIATEISRRAQHINAIPPTPSSALPHDAVTHHDAAGHDDIRDNGANDSKDDSDDDNEDDKAGVVLGIHNVAIAAPQLVATLVSAIIFGALQKEPGRTGDDSVAWVLRFGGLSALLAAWACRKVGDGRGR